jgi:hypothetical protein
MNKNHILNLKRVPKELRLILAIMNYSKSNDNKILPLFSSSTNIDWDLFLELAVHHRVYPILYSYLKKFNLYKNVPAYVFEELSQLYKMNTFQMLQLRAEMEHIGELLIENQIRLLFLKGPVLAAELYGDLSLRTSCDLDILVPLSELEQTEKILVNYGYEKDDYIQTVLGDWKWRHHHVTYHHPLKKIKVEIHWRLNPGPGKEPSFEDLWERKREIKASINQLYYLGKDDLLFFLITHGARHGWARIRWLLDINQIIEQEPDWKRTLSLLEHYSNIRLGGQAIILASELLNSHIPGEIDLSILGRQTQKLSQETIYYIEQMVDLHSDTIPIDVAKYHKRYLLSLMSIHQKFLFMLSCLHPYPTDAETLPLPKKVHFLYFPLRPFLWIWRKSRREALS